ncbi:YceI family protein [Klenkia taihuensis]|uniref:Polyisoprenoid-binding protein YceI n=1 Tax=Klenkia taihuensis TaxID=1225127 RepID=A0A1I1QXM3_9ACTN|nr:YceI family protein [Klenkia taihuensis]GHE07722.1 polyisoprenoid-binding protein [Klenkia taihuensis]SFD22790.1 Polyisoprenoid-binding protein YceI [Klenkia taihuensis]
MAKHRASQSGETDFDDATTALADVSGDYAVDAAHTRIGFRARHAMVTTVRGTFGEFEGTAHLDVANPAASRVELRIDAGSLDTGQPDRDAHLRSADFLDVEQFPEITFVSTAVEQVDDDEYTVTGDVTIKGQTREVSIDFTLTGSALDPFGNTRVGFEGALALKRSQWGLVWNAALETGGVLVSDKVQLEFDVSVIKQV